VIDVAEQSMGSSQPRDSSTENSIDLAATRASARARRRRQRYFALVRVGQIALFVAFLGLWQLASQQNWVDNLFFSRPDEIWKIFATNWSRFAQNASATFQAVVVGFVVASLTGILAGLALAHFRTLDRILDPWLTALNSLPRIALVPLFLLWFGISFQAKVWQASSLVFFILLINTRAGVATVDPDLVLQGKLLHGSPRQIYLHIVVPGALPAIFSGLRLGVAYALLGVIASEMVASREGLGQQITAYGQTLQSAGVFATLAVLAIISAVLTTAVKIAESRLLAWNDTKEEA
jgi:NitT/TauT family transport system permease protein